MTEEGVPIPDELERRTVYPLYGLVCVRGTNVPSYMVYELFMRGLDFDALVGVFHVSLKDVEVCVRYEGNRRIKRRKRG